MSLVNFITEHWCKSSLFRLNIKKFTVPYARLKCLKLDSASLHLVFGASPLCRKTEESPYVQA